VRFAVVFALAGYEDEFAIKTKIEMSSDKDELVRDWATCGLGGIDVDTPEIRAALLARVADADEITRGEALVGLARRKDQRAIKPLIKELERYYEAEHGDYSVEAAEEFADVRLLPVLMRLRASADESNNTRFDEAIRRCSSGSVPAANRGLHRD
jgi:HEAT repeat protein